MNTITLPNPNNASSEKNAMTDQSFWWGFSVESWDGFGLKLMILGGLLGAAALVASLASSFILYKTGNVFQARVATVEKQSEELKAANLALEKQIAPRRLDAVPLAEVISPLESFAGKRVKLASYALDAEGAIVALRIYEALRAAKLDVNKDQASGVAPFGSIAFGVFVDGPNRELVAALVSALSPVQAVAQPLPHSFAAQTDADATVFVAAKPPFVK
jgi:hypothetical protein